MESVKINETIYCLDLKSSKEKLFDFINDNNLLIENQEDSRLFLRIKFIMPYNLSSKFDSLSNVLGYSETIDIFTASNEDEIDAINKEIAFLKDKLKSYDEMLKKLDEKSENYINIWKELKKTESDLFEKEGMLQKYTSKTGICIINITLKHETTSPE